ncbi:MULTISPECIES: hypothetical protein [Cysteiniphilum]|uniref:hypothetical protein n=1 Tax=Cysteiniphilum TaxID=2056696 RepID=UPI001785E7A8|nr:MULTISPECIES: hypothetical protein [Cysteiniphilum]
MQNIKDITEKVRVELLRKHFNQGQFSVEELLFACRVFSKKTHLEKGKKIYDKKITRRH